MKNPIRKIAAILLLAVILPALIFSLYEINSLNESEKVIEEIYNNQLEAILFSVNQYSEDVVSGWQSNLNLILTKKPSDPEYFDSKVDSFLNINKSINRIYFADSIDAEVITNLHYDKNDDSSSGNRLFKSFKMEDFLRENAEKIKRLYTYERGGYSKIEPVQYNMDDTGQVLLFLLNDPEKYRNICVIILQSEKFVQAALGTKIKEIAGEKFTITCTSLKSEGTDNVVFATDDVRNLEIQQKKNLWLIPNYELGILLKGETIETLAKERSTTNLILILVLVLTLISGVYMVFRNIKKQVELAQIKSDFVSNVSHELRTPLALISMFAETLEMGRVKTEEKKHEYYSIISKEAGRLSRIVNKILSFSKIEAGRREYRFSDVNVNKLIQDVYTSYQFHLQNSGFKFCFNPDESIPEIKADGEAISEAVINLVDNAIKYSTDKKEISITTGADESYVFIEIADKGVGISEENQKKIFEKFYRVSDGLVHNTKGTGLGLTLVKHIIDAHSGNIKVKSKLTEGSSFILNFPIDNFNKGRK